MSLRGLWRGLGGQKPKTEEGDLFFGGLLGPSWRVLGAILGSSWPPKGNQERRKSDPKIDQNFVACWVRFLDRFGRFWTAKQDQAGSKIDTKSMLISKNDFSQNVVFPQEKH